jgi:hypothetical protein
MDHFETRVERGHALLAEASALLLHGGAAASSSNPRSGSSHNSTGPIPASELDARTPLQASLDAFETALVLAPHLRPVAVRAWLRRWGSAFCGWGGGRLAGYLWGGASLAFGLTRPDPNLNPRTHRPPPPHALTVGVRRRAPARGPAAGGGRPVCVLRRPRPRRRRAVALALPGACVRMYAFLYFGGSGSLVLGGNTGGST